jgi:hypothetical protein
LLNSKQIPRNRSGLETRGVDDGALILHNKCLPPDAFPFIRFVVAFAK